MLADVTPLVDATTVQDVPPSKRGSYRLLQPLAAIGHDEPATLYLQATLEELAQELTADCTALGDAFDDAQNVLVAIRIDAERDDQHVAAHMDAIEHQNRQIQLAQWTT